MPYIKGDQRILYDPKINQIQEIKTEGDLNYIITSLCNKFLKNHGESYSTYNDIIGVLECAKLEYYRKKISVYENKKEKENGSIAK